LRDEPGHRPRVIEGRIEAGDRQLGQIAARPGVIPDEFLTVLIGAAAPQQ
jgi:hypothetical protein